MRLILILVCAFFLFIVASGISSPASAQTSDLTLELIDARLQILREDGGERVDEMLRGYELARTRLNVAASFDRDAARYVDALTSSSQREANIQARIARLNESVDLPIEVSDSSFDELESQLVLARAELQDADVALNSQDRRLAARQTQTDSLRSRLAEIADQLGNIDRPDLSIDPNAIPSMIEASNWSEAAEFTSLVAESRAKNAELNSQPLRYSALQAERVATMLVIAGLGRRIQALEEGLRRSLADDIDLADFGIYPDDSVFPVASLLKSDNRRLREQRRDVEIRLDAVNVQRTYISENIRALSERFATARQMVDFASDSDVLGTVLLAYWEGIDVFRLADPTIEMPAQIGDSVINRIDHEEALTEIANLSGFVTNQFEKAGLDLGLISDSSREPITILSRSRRDQLRRLVEVESDYIFALSELDAGYTELTTTINEYEEYLSVLILWKPSRLRLWDLKLHELPVEVDNLVTDIREIRVEIRPASIVLVAFAIILFVLRVRIRNAQYECNARIRRPQSDSIRYTFVALFTTGLRALPLALLVLAIGGLYSQDTQSVASDLFTAFNFIANVLFIMLFVKFLCDEQGVARVHFGWNPKICDHWLIDIVWLLRWWLPVAALAAIVFMAAGDSAVIGRLTLLLAVAILIGRIFSSYRRGIQDDEWSWSVITANRLRLVYIAMLVLLATGVFWGLRHSVGIIVNSLLLTICVGALLTIIHNLLDRWLCIVHQRLEFQQQSTKSAEDSKSIDDHESGLLELSSDTTKLLNAIAVGLTAVAMLYIWAPLFPAFDLLSNVSLWTSTNIVDGESIISHITLETLAAVILLVGVTFYAAHKVPAFVELVLRARTEVSAGARYTTRTLMSYVIVGVGVINALSTLGLHWSQLQWLVAALGVGIGFGLQEIVANFFSGLIILFERPIRVGDIVTVGEKDGEVTRIRIRATTIRDLDGKELLVPNKEFITGHLLNWTLSDSHMRIIVEVGIAYGSDLERALKIITGVATCHPKVIHRPAPEVTIENFGDNAVELVIRCFLGEYEGWRQIASELRHEIYRQFAEAEIMIAFPQRDVHFDTEQPIRIVLDSESTS